MLIKDLVNGNWYKSPKTKQPLRYDSAEYRSDDLIDFYFTSVNGLSFIFPCAVPPWANEVAEINVEPISPLEMELM